MIMLTMRVKETITPNKKSKKWLKRLLVALVIILPLVGTSVFGAVYYKKYKDLNAMTADQFSQRENAKTIKEVGKLYSLPKDEQPSIAAIKDKEAVKKQYPFLSQAENGDILLLYKDAQLAILYRPSTKQMVKVGALNIQGDQTSQQLKIGVIGKQAERQAVVKTLGDSKLSAVDSGDAKGNYATTTVVDISGKAAEQTAQVATAIKAQVGSMPAGEDKPAGIDILVIVGTPTP